MKIVKLISALFLVLSQSALAAPELEFNNVEFQMVDSNGSYHILQFYDTNGVVSGVGHNMAFPSATTFDISGSIEGTHLSLETTSSGYSLDNFSIIFDADGNFEFGFAIDEDWDITSFDLLSGEVLPVSQGSGNNAPLSTSVAAIVLGLASALVVRRRL